MESNNARQVHERKELLRLCASGCVVRCVTRHVASSMSCSSHLSAVKRRCIFPIPRFTSVHLYTTALHSFSLIVQAEHPYHKEVQDNIQWVTSLQLYSKSKNNYICYLSYYVHEARHTDHNVVFITVKTSQYIQ